MSPRADCPVCLEDIQANDLVVTFDCNHLLCLQCALNHYIVHSGSSCPYCRHVSTTLVVASPHETDYYSTKCIYTIDSREWCVTMMGQLNSEYINDQIERSLIQQQELLMATPVWEGEDFIVEENSWQDWYDDDDSWEEWYEDNTLEDWYDDNTGGEWNHESGYEDDWVNAEDIHIVIFILVVINCMLFLISVI